MYFGETSVKLAFKGKRLENGMSGGWRTVCQEAGNRYVKLGLGMRNTENRPKLTFSTYSTPASGESQGHNSHP